VVEDLDDEVSGVVYAEDLDALSMVLGLPFAGAVSKLVGGSAAISARARKLLLVRVTLNRRNRVPKRETTRSASVGELDDVVASHGYS
jgi:hypothetical protein